MKKYKKHTKKEILLEGLRLVPSQGGSVKKRLTYNLIDLIKKQDDNLSVLESLDDNGYEEKIVCDKCGCSSTDERRFSYSEKILCNFCY